MAKYHIQTTEVMGGPDRPPKIIFYQGDRQWTTVHEYRKIYNRKADAKADLYDFGGTIVKDSDYDPNEN